MDANKDNLHLYNPALQPFASSLRKEMTKSEACLWKYVLKGRKLKGSSFRRQRPVLNYIADFMCMELMLIIEVDGATHDWDETGKKDQIKNQDLERAGFSVVRFSDEDVLKNINAVLDYLEEWIDNKASSQNGGENRKIKEPPPSRCPFDSAQGSGPPPPAEDSSDERL